MVFGRHCLERITVSLLLHDHGVSRGRAFLLDEAMNTRNSWIVEKLLILIYVPFTPDAFNARVLNGFKTKDLLQSFHHPVWLFVELPLLRFCFVCFLSVLVIIAEFILFDRVEV